METNEIILIVGAIIAVLSGLFIGNPYANNSSPSISSSTISSPQ